MKPRDMKRSKRVDPPGTHYADSKNIVVRSIVGTDTVITWRENLRSLLKSARDHASDEWRRFGYGLLYDAVGWTPGQYSLGMYAALHDCGVILSKKKFSDKDLSRIREKLEHAGFNLVPEWMGEEKSKGARG
jgi:hypothetical protein